MMIRTPFSLLCRRSVAVLARRRPPIWLAAQLNLHGGEISVRQFSDKDESTERLTTTSFAVDQEDDEEANTESSAPPSDMDLSNYTVHVPIRMPDMGESKAKVVRWYKKEGDLVAYNDMLCDIETEEFTFGMVNEDEVDAIMGEIAVPENSDLIDDGDLLCTLLHPAKEAKTKSETAEKA